MSSFEEKYNRWHKWLSFVKSGIRIGACFGYLIAGDPGLIKYFVLLWGMAELVGIAEELF